MSRLGISGIALPAMPCRSPTIPTVESTTARICASRFDHCLPINFRSRFEVFAHVVEFLDHGFDALAEFHAGQILVDLLHLRFLALLDKPRVGKLDQGLPQRHGDGQGATRVSDPNVVDQVEVFDMLWQGL